MADRDPERAHRPLPARKRLAVQTGLALVALLAWETLPRAFDMSPFVLPPFSAVVVQLGQPVTGDGGLLGNASITLLEVTAAFALASAAGVLLGVAISLSPRLRRTLMPLLGAGFAVPLITLIPLFLVTFGLGIQSKIGFGALYAFFPILFNTVSGVGAVDRRYFLLARSLGMPLGQRLGRVVLPGAAKPIVGGLQVGMAIAVIAVVSTEMFGSVAGMGYLIQRAAQGLQAAEVYALVLVTLLLAFILLLAVRLLGRLVGVRLEAGAW